MTKQPKPKTKTERLFDGLAKRSAKSEITQEFVKDRFTFDPETGEFRSIGNRGTLRDGCVAGWKMLNGYIGIMVGSHQCYAHRVAWMYVYGAWPANKIDHINGDRTDNRISNLREASDRLNGQNLRTAHRDSKTGVLGVTYNEKWNRYHVQITITKGKRWTKTFKTLEEASNAYLAMKRSFHEGCTI